MEGVQDRATQACQYAHCQEGSFGCQTVWKTVEVSPFTPDYKPIKVEVVNIVLQYDSPLDGKEYMLVIRNALCVPSMNNNLIPLFIMRENGIVVNECAKIHCEDPT